MYISLRDGWLPLSDLCEKYAKDKGNMNRVLDKISTQDKEKIGNVWLVRESEFIKFIKTDLDVEQDTFTKINSIVDKFTNELSMKLNLTTVQSKFSVKNPTQGDYIIKTFLEWAVKCQIIFPPEIYKFIEEEELYTKFLLVQQVWNKILKQKRN